MRDRCPELTFADARALAINATISLTRRLSTMLAVADVLAAHGQLSASCDLREVLMNTIRAMHVLRHRILAMSAEVTSAEGSEAS